jgi:2-amino-4-hydroxy-6-hydroxymethyldihydropteridine diphosphokinase
LACLTVLSPEDILQKTQAIEKNLGRQTKSIKNSNGQVEYRPRPVDIDILFFDNLTITSENLTIPHPLIAERRFVLQPFAEIAPHFIHPILNRSILQLLNTCSDLLKVEELPDSISTKRA